MAAPTHIHLVIGTSGEDEPVRWIVHAFEELGAADRFAAEYNVQSDLLEERFAEYDRKHPEPSLEQEGYKAWRAWCKARDELRKAHPDERSHLSEDAPRYTVQAVPFTPIACRAGADRDFCDIGG